MKYKFYLSAIILLGAFTLSFSNNLQDSLPELNPNYKGFRLAITDISTQQEGEWINFQFTAINTGVEDIDLKKNDSNSLIVLNLDELNSNPLFKKYTASFKQTLFNSELNIKPGEVLDYQKLKLKYIPVDGDFPISKDENIQTTEIAEVQEQNLSTASAMAKGATISSTDNSECSDLIIESVSIVKKSKSTVTLKYKIKNQGKQPASIVGTSKSQDDNLALKFHMSSSDKLTRGSIPIGGTTVKGGKQIPDGKLYPGKSLTDEVKLDIRNMTRFTPIIILEIDPYLSVQECSKTNNQNHIKVEQ